MDKIIPTIFDGKKGYKNRNKLKVKNRLTISVTNSHLCQTSLLKKLEVSLSQSV